MFKYLTLLAVFVFMIWLIKRQWRLKKLEWQGIKPPEQKGLRPITLLSLVMVVMYGGFLIWHAVQASL